MTSPLLKEKVFVRVGDMLLRAVVYAKSHKGFFLKEDLDKQQPFEYLFADEGVTWFHNLSQAKKIIQHPITQQDKYAYEIHTLYEGRE